MRRLLFLCAVALGCGDDGRPPAPGDGGVFSDGGMTDGSRAVDSGAFDANSAMDATTPMSPRVDPGCVDGMYREVLPDVSADISSVPFSSLDQYVDDVLARRYPVGGALVRGGRMDTRFGQPCDELFGGGASTPDEALQRMNTIVHECGHIYDGLLSSGATNVYVITDTLQLSCSRGDATDRGGDTFARSRINGDEFASLRPPCGGASGAGCDSYADIYLDGDPDDGNFDSGDQGFNLLFDETVEYVNSLAVEWALVDQMAPGRRTSARDGILTFLWYTLRYLRMARTRYPSAYERLANDACWRNAILTVWGRAWLYLQVTEGMSALSIDDSLLDLVTDPVLLEEIQRLRDLEGC